MDAQSEKLLAGLLRSTRIAGLATLRDEEPQLYMVPFIVVEDFSAFYIHASRLAQHSVEMQKNKRSVSLLITENDDGRADPQTLVRVFIRGTAASLQYGEPGFTPIRDLYLTRFPEAEPQFKRDDFSFWRIKPKGGRFVAGTAKSYNITLDTLQKVSQR